MIRTATAADFDFIYGMYMHPKVNPFLLYELMDEASFQPIFDELIEDRVVYIFSENNDDIGMFKLIPLKYRTAHIAYVGGLAIHPDFAGKAHGSAMMSEIIELAKSKGIKRLELSTDENNHRAATLYQKMGFVQEGVLRNYTFLAIENRFINEVLMSLLID